jgi:hypothetical protein
VGDSHQAPAGGVGLDVRGDVGRVDDLRQRLEGRVVREVVLEQDALEGATPFDVPEFDSRHVEGDCSLPLGRGHHLLGGDIQKLGGAIDEAPDEPGARDAIDLGILTSDPFHGTS